MPSHPQELGKMEPLKWYHYNKTWYEPFQGSKLNKEFVIMTMDMQYNL